MRIRADPKSATMPVPYQYRSKTMSVLILTTIPGTKCTRTVMPIHIRYNADTDPDPGSA